MDFEHVRNLQIRAIILRRMKPEEARDFFTFTLQLYNQHRSPKQSHNFLGNFHGKFHGKFHGSYGPTFLEFLGELSRLQVRWPFASEEFSSTKTAQPFTERWAAGELTRR